MACGRVLGEGAFRIINGGSAGGSGVNDDLFWKHYTDKRGQPGTG
jgi:hypothetical protein